MRKPPIFLCGAVHWLGVVSARGITAFVTECGTEAEIHYENMILIPLSTGGRVEIQFETIDRKSL